MILRLDKDLSAKHDDTLSEMRPASGHVGRWKETEGHGTWTGVEIDRDLDAATQPLSRLRAVVLLGGAVRATALQAAIGRSVLDLPVEKDRSLLDCWRDQCAQLARATGMRGLPVRVMLDQAAAEPRHGRQGEGEVVLAVERDPTEYRGTGGVLKDLCEAYGDDDYLLVANASQLPRASITVLAAELATTQSDVTVVSHFDGTPSGLMLVRCGAMRDLPAIGFIDMKEQGLPAIARRHAVRVVERSRPSGLPIRTLADYIGALCRHHRDLKGVSEEAAHLDDWQPAFSLIERASDVHPRALIHNSVVLEGGRVEEGAVVVGSVVCPGGTVRHGRHVADEIVKAGRGK